MRKIAEIKKDLSAKIAEAKGMDTTNAEAVNKVVEEINTLAAELDAANQLEAAEQKLAEDKFRDHAKAQNKRFSLVKFLRELTEDKLSGLELEAAEAGAEEYRRLGLSQAGTVIPTFILRDISGQSAGTDGKAIGEVMPNRYVEILKEKLVISQLGATVLTGLVGTLPVITSAQIAAGWGAEGAESPVTKASFARAEMTPHRNFVSTAFTKDLLRQTSLDVENFLINLMTEAHANLIETAAICGDGTGNSPKGILEYCNEDNGNLLAIGTNGGAIAWKNIVALESRINSVNANRGNLGYLTNAKVVGDMKTLERTSGNGRYLIEGGMTNGYKCEWSNLVPSNLTKGTAASKCSAMIFGNFADLYIGEWGGLDLVIDPYTKARTGEVVLTINAWNDILVAEPKSFAAIKDITTNA